MTKDQLRQECTRLLSCITIGDCIEQLDIYAEFLFKTVQSHHSDPVNTKANSQAKIVVQMMLTKVLHLKGIIAGISYQAKDGSTLNNIIDPTILASLIRNIYEAVSMFNLIYRQPKTSEEKEILYLLWVHSGLKYRQKFESAKRTDENKGKLEKEKLEIEKIILLIEANSLFKSLDDKNQRKIKTKMKEKDYLIKFDGKEVRFLHWHELADVMGIKNGILENIYSYFSLYSHPSNVAVFQFADLFKKGEEAYLHKVKFNLKIAFYMLSIFIADYINLFPAVLKTYESMNLKDQIVINLNNVIMRSHDYSINKAWEAME